jgi:hypothetical protein
MMMMMMMYQNWILSVALLKHNILKTWCFRKWLHVCPQVEVGENYQVWSIDKEADCS